MTASIAPATLRSPLTLVVLGAADVGAAFVLQVFDEVGDFEFAGRFLAGGRLRSTFAAAFAAGLFERRFDEAEGGRVDFVLGAFVADVGLVARAA